MIALRIKFMKTALFTNFTDQEFTGWWDGKKRTFASGESKYMPDYLARHFAKHLTNRELLEGKKPDGSPKYKDGEKMTSPKKPEEFPIFMEIFNKAYTPSEGDELGDKKDDLDTLIEVANKNRQKPEKQDPTQPQIVLPPDYNEDEDLSSFQGKPE